METEMFTQIQTSDLTESSLRLAEAISAYNAMKVLSAVAIMLLIVLVLFYLLDIHLRRREVSELRKSFADLSSFVKSTSEVMKDNAMRSVSLDQTRVLVASELSKSKNAILFFIGKTMQKNNLSDREAVREKVDLFVNQQYGDNVLALNKFDYRQRPLASFLDPNWREEVKRRIIEEFEKHEKDAEKSMNCYTIEAKYSALFDSFKMTINHKIDEIT